jgi:hypothetical protein
MRAISIGNTWARWRWITSPSLSSVLGSSPKASAVVTSTVKRTRSSVISTVSPRAAAACRRRCRRAVIDCSTGKKPRKCVVLSALMTSLRCGSQASPSTEKTPLPCISARQASIWRSRR